MIRSFGSKDTERLWRRERVRSIDPRIHRVAFRKLRLVGSAKVLKDLRVPPGNRLDALKGDRSGQYSVRINDQWRIFFVWTDAGPGRCRSLTTTDKIGPIHPGEVLMEDFIAGFGITQNKLAVSIGVPPRRINEIVHGKRGITADTACDSRSYFGTSAEFWINLQSHYELDRAEDLAGEQITAIQTSSVGMNGTDPTLVGSEDSRLIIIRGNSGSGKSGLAKAIRAARPRGIAIVGHDVLRREILHVRDRPETLSVPYMELSARFALEHGLHVVIEGILHSEIYGEMLVRLRSDHRGVTRSYCYELARDETLRRHRTKPLAEEISVDTVASWYRDVDRVHGLDEVVFDAAVSARGALERVLADVGWSAPAASEAASSSFL